MEPPEHVERNLEPIKIVILGNRAVGKTSLYFQWFHRKFCERSNPGSHLDFFPVQRYIKFSQSVSIKPITLQVWDVSNVSNVSNVSDVSEVSDVSNVSENKRNIHRILANAHLFIVVVDACDKDIEQLAQIKKWHDFIRDYLTTSNNLNSEIIIIQNKIDLEQVNLLNKEALQNSAGKLKDIISVSCKKRQNFSILDAHLTSIAENYFPQQFSISNKIQLFYHKESFDQVSDAINMLTDEQADYLLNYLDVILKMGTSKRVNKPYQLFVFGGGENFSYDNVDNAVIGAESRINGTFPKHMIPILTAIQERRKSAKDLLNYIYLETLSIAVDEPFIRRHSTHLFYSVVLPGYLKQATSEKTHFINNAITGLTDAQAIVIINNFKMKLLMGPCQNIRKPYNIKVGGEGYMHEGILINLPHHAFWMIQKIDSYLEILNINTNNQYILSKSKRILFELYHDTLIAELTFNSSRDPGTQEFYANVLQNYIISELSKIDNHFSRFGQYRTAFGN